MLLGNSSPLSAGNAHQGATRQARAIASFLPAQYDRKIPLYGRDYSTVHDGQFIQLGCSSKRGETTEERARAFEKLKPLCDAVAESIAFH